MWWGHAGKGGFLHTYFLKHRFNRREAKTLAFSPFYMSSSLQMTLESPRGHSLANTWWGAMWVGQITPIFSSFHTPWWGESWRVESHQNNTLYKLLGETALRRTVGKHRSRKEGMRRVCGYIEITPTLTPTPWSHTQKRHRKDPWSFPTIPRSKTVLCIYSFSMPAYFPSPKSPSPSTITTSLILNTEQKYQGKNIVRTILNDLF